MDLSFLKVRMTFRLLAVVCFLYFGVTANAQATRPSVSTSSLDAGKASQNEPRSFEAIEEEMRAKSAIKFAEKSHQENIDRARDLSFLSSAVISSYEHKKQLDREDIKKLEKAEKLAKGIREAAGGSAGETRMEKPPQNLGSALTMLGEISESLKLKVEKTPKHVISAAVIDEANVLLEVIQIVRAFAPKA